jgi:hypothetical protein
MKVGLTDTFGTVSARLEKLRIVLPRVARRRDAKPRIHELDIMFGPTRPINQQSMIQSAANSTHEL